MQILVDTNVLLRSLDDRHTRQAAAAAAIDKGLSEDHILVVVPQVLYEFWVVATRPARQNGLGWTTEETDFEMRTVFEFCTLLRDERAIYDRWFDLVKHYDVKGKNAHDARLVAAMTRHGVTHILTFNVKDFRRYHDIVTISPDDILDGTATLDSEE